MHSVQYGSANSITLYQHEIENAVEFYQEGGWNNIQIDNGNNNWAAINQAGYDNTVIGTMVGHNNVNINQGNGNDTANSIDFIQIFYNNLTVTQTGSDNAVSTEQAEWNTIAISQNGASNMVTVAIPYLWYKILPRKLLY